MGFRPRTTGVSVAVILAMGVPLASASAAGAAPEYKSASVLTTYNTQLKADGSKVFKLTATDADSTAALTFSATTPAHGTVAFGTPTVTGSAPATDTVDFTYTPTDATSMATYNDTVTISIKDDQGNTTTQNVTIAVKDNKVPTGTAITNATTGVNTPVDITLNGSDDQTSAGNLTYNLVAGSAKNGTVSINDNKATFDPTKDSSDAGSFKYTVSDGMGGVSDPISVSVAVTKGSAVTLSGAADATVGAKQTLVASVAAVPADSSATLTGGVKFYAQTGSGDSLKETELGAGTRGTSADANKWTLETTKLPAGDVKVLARYDGDSTYAKSASAPAAVNIAKATATTEVTAPANTRVGDPMDVTAKVTASQGAPAPSNGKIQFFWKAGSNPEVEVSSPISSTDGTYKATVAAPSADPDGKLIAKFTGDDNLTAADASATVNAAKGTSGVTVSVASSSYGLGVKPDVSAYVTPEKYVAGGTVEFWDNGNVITGQDKVTVNKVGDKYVAKLDYTPTTTGEHKITAYYSGDNNLNRSLDSVGATFTVNAASSMMSAPTVSPNSGKVGDSVTLSSDITTTGSPSAKVQFYVVKGSAAPVAIGNPVALTNKNATLPYTLTSAGSQTFTAKYLGDSNVKASDMSAASTAVNVTQATAAIGDVVVKDSKDATQTSVAAGAPVKLTAAITPIAGLSASDVVSFYEGDPAASGKKLGNGTLDPKTGVAAMNYTFDTVGTHNFFAVFEGNDNLAKKTTENGSALSVTKATPVVALTGNPGGVGKPVELTASVNTKGASAEGAKIQFSDAASGQKIGDPVAVMNGKATVNTANITNAGTYQYKAVLAETTNLLEGSDTQSVKVAAAASSQKLEAKTGSDGKVTITSTVSGPEGVSTDGKVTFYVDDTQVGSADVTKGVATLSGVTITSGSHSVTATYASSGDLSNSVASTKVVLKAAPKVELTAPEKVTAGEAAKFSVKVSADAASKPFDGTVNLMAGGKVVGSGKVAADGTGVVSATFPQAGEQSVVAAFEGNDTLTTADSAAVTVTVAAAPTTPPTTDPSTPVTKDAAVSAPVISGKAAVGQKLTGKVASHTEGTTLTYQWLRNDAPISGANSASYTLTAADYGKKIRLGVQAAGTGFKPAQAASTPVTVGAGTFVVSGGPSLAGATVKTGYTLKLNRGTWTPAPSFTYQWLRDGKLVKSGVTSYKLTTADRGHTIRVRVIGKKAGYTTATKYTNTTPKVK